MANFDALIKQLREERDRMDQAIAALSSINGTKTLTSATRPKRYISAAGIARIRAAAKARWARVRPQKKK